MSQALTEVRSVDLVFPRTTNHYGTMFAGDELAALARIAFVAATRHTRARLVLRASTDIAFTAPAPQGRLVELIGRVVEASGSTVTVEAELVAEDLLTGARTSCASGRFALVAVDEAGKAIRLPGP
ncbi:MAG: acyl-CoA thioesterase [Alphaproteobacteria bacterium]